MILLALLFLSVDLSHPKPKPILADVNIGSAGPYRFLIDTGAESSMIDPELAFHLHLEPQFQVEIQTEHSSYPAPAMKISTLRLGTARLPPTELILQRVDEAKKFDPLIEGKLGLNAFFHLDLTLLPQSGSLTLTREKPHGEAVPFTWSGERITLKAAMGDETLKLVLDSGSDHVILFRLPAAMAGVPAISATMRTIEGARSIVPIRWTARMSLTKDLHLGMLPAAVVINGQTQVDGLLPVSSFRAIHIDQGRSEVVLQQ